MNFSDLIVKGGEVTKAELFVPEDKVCLLMLTPKTESSPSVEIISVKLSENKSMVDYPFVAGMWNPVVVKKANITAGNLNNFRIFWGIPRL